MKPTRNLPLIVGIALPIVFILIISIIVFTPSLFIHPKYNFLYMADNGSYYNYDLQYSNTYTVTGGRVVLQAVPKNPNNTYITYKTENPPLYIYDVKNNTSHQLTLDEAQKLSIDPGPSSPDGYTISYKYGGYNGGIFDLFGGGSRSASGWAVSKGSGAKILTGITGPSDYSYYSDRLKFLGWVK